MTATAVSTEILAYLHQHLVRVLNLYKVGQAGWWAGGAALQLPAGLACLERCMKCHSALQL